jgi:hypothetical protein
MGLGEALVVFEVSLPGELVCDIVATKSNLYKLVVNILRKCRRSVQSDAIL